MRFISLTYMTTVFLSLALTALAQDTTISDDSTYTIDPISTTDDYPLPSYVAVHNVLCRVRHPHDFSRSTDTTTDIIPTDTLSSIPSYPTVPPSITTSRIVSITSRPISTSTRRTTPVDAPSSTVSASSVNGALPTMNSKLDKLGVGMFAGLIAAVVL